MELHELVERYDVNWFFSRREERRGHSLDGYSEKWLRNYGKIDYLIILFDREKLEIDFFGSEKTSFPL